MPHGLRRSTSALTRDVILGFAVVVAVSSARAEETAAQRNPAAFTAISPIFSQLVMFSLPSDFQTVFEDGNDQRYIREAVLKGETTVRWSQMITVTGAKGVAHDPQVTPESFAAGIAAGFKKACPRNFSGHVFGPAEYSGQSAFIAVASCGKVDTAADKHAETALIVAVKGQDDFYTIQWAERAPASAENLTVDPAPWKARLEKLDPIRFCPVVPGEKAPFPSCLNR